MIQHRKIVAYVFRKVQWYVGIWKWILCRYLNSCWRFNKIDTDISSHWGRMTHICVGNLTIIGSDNGLSPGQRQAMIWTNAGILLFGPLGTNFNEIVIGIQTFSAKKIHLKTSSGKWRPLCIGLNVFIRLFKFQTALVMWEGLLCHTTSSMHVLLGHRLILLI